MLLDLREKVRSSKPIKYTLITLISIPFVLFGIGSYFSGGNVPTVAEVNGQTIDQQQLDRAYQQQRMQMARMFGGSLPDAFDNEAMFRQQALDQLISQQVLESEVAEQGFAVGDETLGRAIRELPMFQVDGQFDTETYQTQLRASGLTVPMFEQSFRDDTAINQFRNGVSSTSFTLPQEQQRLSDLSRQTRTIEAVQFDVAAASEDIEVSDEDVEAYFSENSDSYQFPERAKIQYIELSGEELAQGIDITEEQAQTFYEENRANYILPEQREASHILLSLDDAGEDEQIAAIAELKTRIESGESFEDLAKELSDDVGSADAGGVLGPITPGAMVAEFEEAVYALGAEGDLSEPVVTEFGVHLIRLDSITPESGKPFEDVKEEIISTLQRNESDREFFDLREMLAEQSFDNPGSLDAASDATGLEIKTSDWLDSDTESGEVLSHPDVFNATFSEDVLVDGNNSDVIEVADRHIVVLRVLEHEDPRPKTLEDVADEVRQTLVSQRAAEKLSAELDSAIEQLAAGETAASIAQDNPLATAFEQEVLDRQSSLFDRSVIARVFSLAQSADHVITDRATLANGDQIAIRLDAVSIPEADAETSEDADAPPPRLVGVDEAGFNPRLGNTEFQAMLESLRDRADVDVSIEISP